MQPDHRLELAGIAGDTATLIGWLALDADHVDDAWAYFRHGARAAREAEDPALHAFALGESAYVMLRLDRPDDAAAVIDEAEAKLRDAPAPQMRVWLQSARAEVLASTHDADGCQRALDLAHEGLDAQLDDPLDLPYVSYLDAAHLTRWAGCCLAQLGRLDASTLLERAMASADPSFVRAQAGLLVDLATAHAVRGDLERSCGIANEAIGLALETGSVRQLNRVRHLRPRLEAAAGTDAYTALLDQLGDADAGGLSRAST